MQLVYHLQRCEIYRRSFNDYEKDPLNLRGFKIFKFKRVDADEFVIVIEKIIQQISGIQKWYKKVSGVKNIHRKNVSSWYVYKIVYSFHNYFEETNAVHCSGNIFIHA